MIDALPKSAFSIKITGEGVLKLIDEIKDNIVEVTLVDRKNKRSSKGHIIGVKDKEGILVRTDDKLEEKAKYEFGFISGRGVVLLKATVLETLKGVHPNIYVFNLPKEISVCERRKYYRIKPKERVEVIIRRENGYALSGNLGDISLGGFSLNIQMKDRMLEYFLPLINEEVRFSIDLPGKGKNIRIDGTASLKHYTVDAQGFYRGGFHFSKIDRKKLKNLLKLLQRKKRR